jgi:hypothetical protein
VGGRGECPECPECPFPALSPSLLLAVLLASPAAAQGRRRGGARTDPVDIRQIGSEYEVYEDAHLVIGGDVNGSCDTVLRAAQQGVLRPTRETYTQSEGCEEAGFSVADSETLPEPGGPPVSTVLAAPLLGGAVLSLCVRRGSGSVRRARVSPHGRGRGSSRAQIGPGLPGRRTAAPGSRRLGVRRHRKISGRISKA